MFNCFKTSLALLCSSVALSGLANEANASWCHETHYTESGLEVRWDYQVKQGRSRYSGRFFVRSNGHLHVSSDDLRPSDKLHAVVLELQEGGGQIGPTRKLDLVYDPGTQSHHVAVPDIYYIVGTYGGSRRQEVGLSLNGEWQKARGTWKTNLEFDAVQVPGHCHNPD